MDNWAWQHLNASPPSRRRDGPRRRPAQRHPAPTCQPRDHLHLPARHRQQRDHRHRPSPSRAHSNGSGASSVAWLALWSSNARRCIEATPLAGELNTGGAQVMPPSQCASRPRLGRRQRRHRCGREPVSRADPERLYASSDLPRPSEGRLKLVRPGVRRRGCRSARRLVRPACAIREGRSLERSGPGQSEDRMIRRDAAQFLI
jgi:hypothetical protein